MYRQQSTGAFWDDTWHRISDESLRHALRPTKRMGSHAAFFRRWLPRDGVILGASCGTGVWIRQLRMRGYECVGLDFVIRHRH